MAALDNRALAGIRGGYMNASGVLVTFSFQQATFVNDNLTQSIIIPTFTVSPGSPAVAIVGAGNASVLPPGFTTGDVANRVQLAPSTATIQSSINNGLTHIISALGAGGISNTISNSANDQLVRQVITANIDISGLSKMLHPSVASSVIGQLQAANAQFR